METYMVVVAACVVIIAVVLAYESMLRKINERIIKTMRYNVEINGELLDHKLDLCEANNSIDSLNIIISRQSESIEKLGLTASRLKQDVEKCKLDLDEKQELIDKYERILRNHVVMDRNPATGRWTKRLVI